jgi:hypothetical protein
VDYPLSVNDDGVNIKPENMEKEHLYHCVFKNKVILLYKEEEDLVNQIKNSSNDSDVEKILQSFIDNKDIKN